MGKFTYSEPREYDERRKAETFKKLKNGIKYLRTLKKFENKKISVYALSKYTGIRPETINKFPEIKKMLSDTSKTTKEIQELKTAVVKVEYIKNLEQALPVIEYLKNMYNETKDKYNELIKVNTRLNLEISKLTLENNELKNALTNKK